MFFLSIIFQIPTSSEGKSWFTYVDETITMDILRKLTDEFLYIFEKSNSRLKNKMKSITTGGASATSVDRPLKDSESAGSSSSQSQSSSGHHKHHHNHHPSHSSSKDHRSHKQITGRFRFLRIISY